MLLLDISLKYVPNLETYLLFDVHLSDGDKDCMNSGFDQHRVMGAEFWI